MSCPGLESGDMLPPFHRFTCHPSPQSSHFEREGSALEENRGKRDGKKKWGKREEGKKSGNVNYLLCTVRGGEGRCNALCLCVKGEDYAGNVHSLNYWGEKKREVSDCE